GPAVSSKVPERLGQYRPVRFIQSGNSCQIWEAVKDGASGRFVLKLLRRDHYGNRAEIAYLKHEYEVAHGLDHPNVIHIYEFAQQGKIAFLVLEVFAVLNFKMALRENRQRLLVHFPKIIKQCAAALGHLHEKKWVHCDIKPDNFLLNDEEEVKLIDFTIAKKIAGGLGRLFSKKGVIRGTRSYMSPEQIRGKPLDARSDVYSLGCVMHELLAGKVPYTGSSPNDLLQKHLSAPIPSMLVQNNNLTEAMNDLVRRTMSKDPNNRPESMGELLKEFSSLRPFKTAPKLTDADCDEKK
ncbi:MAG: serine/threonine-protein kinase, partial [Pirellulaceae bacterium]